MNKFENPGFQLPEETFEDVEGHLRVSADGPTNETESTDLGDDVQGHLRRAVSGPVTDSGPIAGDDVEGHVCLSDNGLNADR